MTARIENIELLTRAQDLQREKQWAEAIPLWREHLADFPEDTAVWFNLGAALQATAKDIPGRMAAGECYQKVIGLQSEPDTKAHAMNNLGTMMLKLGQHAKATVCFHLAVQIDPGNAAARTNLGDALRYEGKYDEADREFAEVMRLDPDSHGARFSRGMIRLLLGDLEEGFIGYESRFFVDSFPAKRFVTDVPEWKGEDLDGKTILCWQEQGYGDAIQFVRYCREVKVLWPSCRIVFRGDEALRGLLSCAGGVDEYVTDASETLYDYHVSVMSLPHRLGTTLATIPAKVPYIRPAGNGWSFPFYDELEKKKKVALVWAGSPRHGRDEFRSFAPELFQPLIDAHPECAFYSLQCGPRASEAERLKGVTDLAPSIGDWTDTAQALQQVDLLISVDTAVVHLAGALARPVWMLCPHSPDWRWLLGRSDSPYYPTMKIFRQKTVGDWDNPIREIISELHK